MASSMIHLVIAKKIKEKANIKIDNEKEYYLGSIAPDLSKQIGKNKIESHFLINTKNDVPNIKIFTKRYPTFKYNSFNLGYFTHLYVDKIWFEEFIPTLTDFDSIKLLDGTVYSTNPEEITQMIYSDYTNLNIKLIENYDLDLSLFYEDFVVPKTNLKEIPVDKLDILINKMGILIENSKEVKAYSFDLYPIEEFINKAIDEIVDELKKY